MNNLFQLSAQYQKLMDKIDETDDISEELMNALMSVNDSLENKILSYAAIIKTIEAKGDGIARAILSMEKRYDALEKSIESLKERVKKEMQKCHKERVENEYHKVLLIFNNPKVKFTDKTLIPERYMRRKIHEIIEPNTQLISQALKNDIEVPGAFLVKDQRLEIK